MGDRNDLVLLNKSRIQNSRIGREDEWLQKVITRSFPQDKPKKQSKQIAEDPFTTLFNQTKNTSSHVHVPPTGRRTRGRSIHISRRSSTNHNPMGKRKTTGTKQTQEDRRRLLNGERPYTARLRQRLAKLLV